ncbi:hypothetical protein CR973_02645 [Candidatus Saccharibacteria bacterium]|nr:MAG: hypothetical protein CR973_02645 [Candidatus Saccharibacteria bacterium]
MTEQHSKRQGGRKPWWRKKQPRANSKPKGNYAFIDSQNLNLGVQKIGWKMDWAKFREWLRSEHNVTQAYMFIGYMAENEALYEQMYAHGFLVVLKPTLEIKQRVTPSEQRPAHAQSPAASGTARNNRSAEAGGGKTEDAEKALVKGNIDADLVLYAMKELPNYDKAVIVSGDGDFFSLVEYLAQEKKLLKLLVPNRRFSTLLQGFDEYIEGIDQHRRELAYRDFRRNKVSGRRSRK